MNIINLAIIQKLRKLKADKSNVLERDNTEYYEPTQPFHPATKSYVDTFIKTYVDRTELITTEKIEISNNSITLPFRVNGTVVNNYAMIFENLTTPVMFECTCTVSEDGWSILFDPNDNLNGLFATVSYMTVK